MQGRTATTVNYPVSFTYNKITGVNQSNSFTGVCIKLQILLPAVKNTSADII